MAFAFSIKNFKRSEEGLNALMELAETELLEIAKLGYALTNPSVLPQGFLVADMRAVFAKSWMSMVWGRMC